MKKLLLLLIIASFFKLQAQDKPLASQVNQISESLIKSCKAPGTKVAVLGFFPKNSSTVSEKFCSFVKDNVVQSLEGKYVVIDPSVVENAISEVQWDYLKKDDHSLLEKLAFSIYQKNDMIVGAFLIGEIEDLGDDIKVSASMIKNEIYTVMGSAFVKVKANEESDQLLGKEITHKAKTPEPVKSASTEPAPSTQPKEVVFSTTTTATTTVSTTEEVKFRGGADPLKGLKIADEKKALQVGTYYALVIGIDNYSGTWPKLSNAVNDAKALETLLKSKYKFDAFRTLYNDQATRENIINEFEYLIKSVKENDNVLIYYSGHGEYKQELNKGFWVPVDANSESTSRYISNNDIQTYLSGIKSKHTLLISDACFSGDIFRGKTISIPFEESERYYSKVYNLNSRKAITSGGIEPVMDGGKDGHSVFAYYLLKNLTSNNNNFYDASQLFDALKIPVVNNSQQSPNFQPIKDTGDEGGQFIFIKK